MDWQGVALGAAPSSVIAFSLRDSSSRVIYVAMNPYAEAVNIALPGPGPSGIWRLVVDTSRLPPDDINLQGPLLSSGQPLYELAPKAGVLMVGAQLAEKPIVSGFEGAPRTRASSSLNVLK